MALPASLVVIPTQGFFFLVFFKKTIILWLGGGSKGQISVWDEEIRSCVISNLNYRLLQFGFWEKTSDKHAPSHFFSFFIIITLTFA